MAECYPSNAKDIDRFKAPDKVKTKPTLKDLQRCVTLQHAPIWREIGIQLDLSDGELSIIHENNRITGGVTRCCNVMLAKWLEVDLNASWEKLFTAIEHCTRRCTDKESTHVRSHSEHLKSRYIHTRFISEQEEWPPDQPRHFTNLALIVNEDGCTERDVTKATRNTCIDVTMSSHSSSPNTSSEHSHVTTSKVFAPNIDGKEPRSILIEGAPGIGKTILSKEISVQWAHGSLLTNMVLLFLIFLRDPLVRTIKSLKDLVKYYYQFDESSDNVAGSCADYLLQSNGEHVTFIFDGFDEYPEDLLQNGFIADILERRVLPGCCLVVTSRPHASAHLRRNCDRCIEIFGFTKENRKNYITNSLKEQDVDKVMEYLDTHLTIDSLCYIPFNMTVLLWLYKQVVFPNNSTELYNYFICHTIRHHLSKYQISLCDSFVDLNSLEEPYRQVIQQLCFLSYKALDKNQLTFMFDEIKTACLQIDKIPGAYNGFGLLQAVQYFGIKKNTILNFVHFSIQEFLAAHYISSLPHYEEFCTLQEKFMSDFYANTFTMYVGMTKGQRPAFKQYLNGSGKWTVYMYGILGRLSPLNMYRRRVTIRPDLLGNRSYYFRLYRCFFEAGDEELCNEIGKAYYDYFEGIVSVLDVLLPSDVHCLGIFLCSRTEWQGFFWYQHFDDVGFQILHKLLTSNTKSTYIREIHIGGTLQSSSAGNILTRSSSRLITEIAKSCKTKFLIVFTSLLLLEDVVSLKGQLTELKFDVETNPTAIETYVPRLLDNNKILKVLEMYGDCLSEDLISVLAGALKCNDALERLHIPGIYSREDESWIRDSLTKDNSKVSIHFEVLKHAHYANAMVRIPDHDPPHHDPSHHQLRITDKILVCYAEYIA